MTNTKSLETHRSLNREEHRAVYDESTGALKVYTPECVFTVYRDSAEVIILARDDHERHLAELAAFVTGERETLLGKIEDIKALKSALVASEARAEELDCALDDSRRLNQCVGNLRTEISRLESQNESLHSDRENLKALLASRTEALRKLKRRRRKSAVIRYASKSQRGRASVTKSHLPKRRKGGQRTT